MKGKESTALELFPQANPTILEDELDPDDDTYSLTSETAESQKSVTSNRCFTALSFAWRKTLGRIGEEWMFLATLGIVMGVISLMMDYGIATCNKARIWLSSELISIAFLQYVAWVSVPVCLILFSTSFTSLVAPQAAGSGIPEMKTILRGVILKESLSFKALVTKIIGLTATLGTGLPLGKEGPFVHISSMVAMLLTKVVSSFRGLYYNKSRNYDMLASSCAVGVAAAFAAPIGGVLFSIEVTTAYFAVRNYWRGFFAAVCSAVMFRLLAIWVKDEDTISVLFETNFTVDMPFAPAELFVFALIGVICGFLGALFIWVHRKYSLFLKANNYVKRMNKRSRLIYPFLVTLIYSTLTFPLGLGQFVSGDLTTSQQLAGLFSNFSWTNDDLTVSQYNIVEDWTTPWTGIFLNLLFYAVFTFFGTIVACTLPVPAGIFVPVFKIGAALGRIVGETMAVIFPDGISVGTRIAYVIPGGYSVVGAAAMVGAVTGTVSTSVIAFELTGQITHGIPIMIAVLIANAICQGLQPSIFDSIIQMKKLPYLPNLITSTEGVYDIFVENFMIRDIKFVWYGIRYNELKEIVIQNSRLRAFPLVDSPGSMVLLGSVRKKDLLSLLSNLLGKERKARYFREWTLLAEKSLEEELKKNKDEETQTPPLPIKGLKSIPFFDISAASSVDDLLHDKDQKDVTAKQIFENEAKKTWEEPLPSDNPALKELLRQRRPSRFSVTKVEGPLVPGPSSPPSETSKNEESEKSISDNFRSKSRLGSSGNTTVSGVSQPPKSILKKTRSFVFQPNTPNLKNFGSQHYATIHGEDSGRLRQALSTLKKARSLVRMDSRTTLTFSGVSRSDFPTTLLIEKIREQELKWEENELDKVVDFTKCRVDPAPHQLVERTNLLKVHFMFSMLTLNHAYVTAIGRLIGVVSLTVLRHAIEDVNAGEFHKQSSEAEK